MYLRRFPLFLAVAAAGCGVDLASKAWAFASLGLPAGPGQPRKIAWLIEPYAGFETSLNEGALFGIGQGFVTWFAILSIGATIGILYWLFVAGAARDWSLTIALGCVTGGILGNLYDRLALHGIYWTRPEGVSEPARAVRDFLLLQASPQWVWPNFNIADCLLVCGSIWLLWHGFRQPTAPPTKESVPTASSSV